MIIIIRKRLLKSFIVTILIGVLGLCFYGYMRNRSIESDVSMLVNSTNVVDKTSLTAFLISITANEQRYKNVEIFDVKNGKVVKRVESSSVIQDEVTKYLEHITGVYVKVKALPENGYIIRVPLEPPVKVQNQWLKEQVGEAFIIFPQNKAPYLLVLDNKARPLFYNFEGNTDELLKSLDFQIRSME